MAIRNIGQIYDLMRYIVRKERGAMPTIPEVMSALDSAQMIAYSEYFKFYATDQTIHDALDQFRVYQPFTSAADGSVAYPSDYQHLLAGVFTVTGSTVNKVRFVQTDEFPDAITNQLRPVSSSKPIALDTATGFQLYPQSQQTGAYNYMRRPTTPNLVYSQVGRKITYDIPNSTELEWLDVYIDNIIAKALKYLGVNTDEDKVSMFAQQLDKETT